MRRKIKDPFYSVWKDHYQSTDHTATRVAVDNVRCIPLKSVELLTLNVAELMAIPIPDRPSVCSRFVRLLANSDDPIDRAHAWAVNNKALAVKVVIAPKPREISVANSQIITEAIADLEGKSPHTTIGQVIAELVAQTAIDDDGKVELLAYCTAVMEQITLEGGDVSQDD